MDGHRVRIAQQGYARDHPAETLDDVQCGIGCYWVEIDGHRFDRVISAEVRAVDGEVAFPTLVLRIVGPVEIVYLDADGEPLGTVELESTPEMVHGTIIGRSA